MKLTDGEYDELKHELRQRVTVMAEDVASWVNIDESSAERILDGIKDGDPEILDAFPCLDWSGQWADAPNWEAELRDAILAVLENDEVGTEDALLNDDFEDLFHEIGIEHANSVIERSVEKRARYYLR